MKRPASATTSVVEKKVRKGGSYPPGSRVGSWKVNRQREAAETVKKTVMAMVPQLTAAFQRGKGSKLPMDKALAAWEKGLPKLVDELKAKIIHEVAPPVPKPVVPSDTGPMPTPSELLKQILRKKAFDDKQKPREIKEKTPRRKVVIGRPLWGKDEALEVE